MRLKKSELIIIVAASAAILFTGGFFTGRASRAAKVEISPLEQQSTTYTPDYSNESNESVNSENDSIGLIDINTADSETLSTIPGIGEKLSEHIIEYRNKNGLFATIEDIMNVEGIGESLFESIKDYITV